MQNKVVIVLFLMMVAHPGACTFFDEHAEGWFWYQSPLETLKPPTPLTTLSPTEQMKAYQQKIEDSLNLAILEPTEQNLTAYAKNYFEVIHKGQRFTDAYQLMLLRNPRFDYALQFPINPMAQQVYANQKEVHLQTAIQHFAKTHGFFFFFSGSCPYCHLFAPIVKRFAKRHHISVLAITLNQQKLPDFPNALHDNGAARLFKVTHLPALFAVNPKTKAITPIAHGAISLSQLEENVLRVVEYQGRYQENAVTESPHE